MCLSFSSCLFMTARVCVSGFNNRKSQLLIISLDIAITVILIYMVYNYKLILSEATACHIYLL